MSITENRLKHTNSLEMLKLAVDMYHLENELKYQTIQALLVIKGSELECKNEILDYIKQKGVACIAS